MPPRDHFAWGVFGGVSALRVATHRCRAAPSLLGMGLGAVNGGDDAPVPSTRSALAVFSALFVVSRCILHAFGLRYCTEHVGAIMHFPPLDLLRDRLGETLWYMHGQPPLSALVIGLCLKWGEIGRAHV